MAKRRHRFHSPDSDVHMSLQLTMNSAWNNNLVTELIQTLAHQADLDEGN